MAQVLERPETKPTSSPSQSRGRLGFPHIFFWNRVSVLDANNLDHIQIIADDLADGEVAVTNMCGVIGFVINGANANAIDKVCEIKGRDKLTNPLVIGASAGVRNRLVDSARLPQGWQTLSAEAYDLPHFFELPVIDLPVGIGMQRADLGRVGAIFWTNFYPPLAALENALLVRVPEGFVGGTSANKHGQGSVDTTSELLHVFGQNRGWGVNHVLRDARFEARRPFSGSHPIFKYNQLGEVVLERGGGITLRSFQQVYPNLQIPEGWQDRPGAIDVDITKLRQTRNYLAATSGQG